MACPMRVAGEDQPGTLRCLPGFGTPRVRWSSGFSNSDRVSQEGRLGVSVQPQGQGAGLGLRYKKDGWKERLRKVMSSPSSEAGKPGYQCGPGHIFCSPPTLGL